MFIARMILVFGHDSISEIPSYSGPHHKGLDSQAVHLIRALSLSTSASCKMRCPKGAVDSNFKMLKRTESIGNCFPCQFSLNCLVSEGKQLGALPVVRVLSLLKDGEIQLKRIERNIEHSPLWLASNPKTLLKQNHSNEAGPLRLSRQTFPAFEKGKARYPCTSHSCE